MKTFFYWSRLAASKFMESVQTNSVCKLKKKIDGRHATETQFNLKIS